MMTSDMKSRGRVDGHRGLLNLKILKIFGYSF